MRPPHNGEKILLASFAAVISNAQTAAFMIRDDLLVAPIHDGGMGSFLIYAAGEQNKNCPTCMVQPTLAANDIDGTPVYATLFVSGNMPVEIDLWKVDFSSLTSFPLTWKKEPNF